MGRGPHLSGGHWFPPDRSLVTSEVHPEVHGPRFQAPGAVARPTRGVTVVRMSEEHDERRAEEIFDGLAKALEDTADQFERVMDTYWRLRARVSKLAGPALRLADIDVASSDQAEALVADSIGVARVEAARTRLIGVLQDEAERLTS